MLQTPSSIRRWEEMPEQPQEAADGENLFQRAAVCIGARPDLPN
jgi:hypothetical protein